MRYALILVLFSILPLSAYADIGNSSTLPNTTSMILWNSSLRQTLGTNLSGTATSLEFFIEQRSNLGGYAQRPEILMWECEDEEYIICTQTSLLSLNLGNADRPLTKRTNSITYTFDPSRFYFLEFTQSGTSGHYFIGGTDTDTFNQGGCFASRFFFRRPPCKDNASLETQAFDISFLLIGVDRVPPAKLPITDAPTIFLPGIFGSKLYIGEEKIWDGLAGEKMSRLTLDQDGKSINSVQVGETLFEFSALGLSIDVYKTLKDHFACDGTFASPLVSRIPGNEDVVCDTPLISYPYDWRYDVFDIIDTGTTYTSGNTVGLIELVEHLANNETGKVNIIAHSNGGLLAKALMVRLRELGKENLVDTIVLIASPQLGTPSAITAMLHGNGQAQLFGLVKRADTTRTLSLNSPGIYSLLPSQTYIEANDPIIEFDSSFRTAEYRNTFGQFIDTYDEFVRFLSNADQLRNAPRETDLNAPTILNTKLLEKARNTHEQIDAWSPGGETRFVQIIGIGNETIKRLSYSTGLEFDLDRIGGLKPIPRIKLWYRPVRTTGGDSEVIAQASETGVGETYYFDLGAIREILSRKVDHGNILIESEMLNTIDEILNRKINTSAFLSETNHIQENELSRYYTVISLYSPVIITVEDPHGNISQITYNDESGIFSMIENIPGSFIDFVGEAKYIYLPKGISYEVDIAGIDTGSFDLVISETNEDGEIGELQRFKNIPIKKSSLATLSISSNNEPGDIYLDINADGNSDYTFPLEDAGNEILSELERNILSLPIRPRLKSIFSAYFDLLETAESEEDRANYTAQIKRLIRYLNGRHISQDTADTWTALAEHLQ